MIAQGELVSDHVPPIYALTNRGVQLTTDYTIDQIDYSGAFTTGGGNIVVSGTVGGDIPFEYALATQDTGESVYYYIDAGALEPVASTIANFEALKQTNPNLINTDAVDKYAAGEDDWGRLNPESDVTEYWANDAAAITSIFEVRTNKEVNGVWRTPIEYRLTNLPAGEYTVEIGVDVKTWGSNRRDIYFSMWEEGADEVVLGMQSGYNGANVWSYPYTKAGGEDVPVVFSAYTQGENRANPVISYVIVKQVTRETDDAGNALRAGTLTLPSNISATQTDLVVGGVESAGALIVLMDADGRLIAERKATAAEAEAQSITFTGLNLRGVGTLRAQQFVEGKLPSSNAELPISSFELSAPRIEWSAEADVITILPSGNNIASIEYRDGAEGDWIDIKASKFFRATHNGIYYVRMTTTSGFTITEVITVSRVDTLSMVVANDLTAWTNSDMQLRLDFSGSARAMQSVVVADGDQQTDITATGVDGVYTYTATHNGTYTVTAVSEGGTRQTFEVEVRTIDKEEASLDYALSVENGVYFVEFSTQSLGDVGYSYTYNGGEELVLNQSKVPLYRNGSYVYKMTNMLGDTAEVSIVSASVPGGDGAIGATVNGSEYSFTFADGLENVRLVRLDGSGGDVALNGNSATLSESGTYAAIAESGDTVYITTFFVAEQAAEAPAEETGCNSTLSGAGIALGAVAVVAAGTLIIVWRKRHDESK